MMETKWYRSRSISISNAIFKPMKLETIRRTRSDESMNISSINRKTFNGRITASMIIVSELEGLNEVCENYNQGDKSNLFDDRPYKICALTLDQIKMFPNAKSNSLSYLITPEMERQAYLNSRNFKYGRDFVLENSLQHARFEGMPSNLGMLCEVLLPTGDKRYPNIDIGTISEKTEYDDKSILYTAMRGAIEEIGIDLFNKSGREIFHSSYQNDFRKKYYPNLPYNFSIGSFGRATECIVVGAKYEDLIDCQIVKENRLTNEETNYLRYESMIHRILDED